MRTLSIALIGLLLGAVTAHAEKTGSWAGAPPEVLQWLQEQKQPGSNISCCGVGDAVNVEILGGTATTLRLRVTNGRGNAVDGTILIADRKSLVRTNLDPQGEAVAWVSAIGTVYCVSVPPGT